MKLTKYEHACFIVENEQSEKIIVDPGKFTTLPTDLSNIVAIVITHVHADHFSIDNINKIKDSNPNLVLYVSEEVSSEVAGAIRPDNSQGYQAGGFNLKFYGDKHEYIRSALPQPDNLGVIINNLVAYPGDSYSQESVTVKYLMTPSSAPWLRMREAEEFIVKTEAEVIIPTHDAMLSEIGIGVYDNHLSAICEDNKKTYRRLAVPETIELN